MLVYLLLSQVDFGKLWNRTTSGTRKVW